MAVEHAVFVVAPVVVTIFVLATIWAHDGHGEDFNLQYWVTGWRVDHGLSPYAGLHQSLGGGLDFPYPAFTALCFAPFALIPRVLSSDLFTALCIAAPLLSLRLLSVRDWRLYGFVLLLAPVVAGWQTSNLTLPLVLGVAALWRLRDRPLATAVLVATLISLKLFLWPLALWLVVSRRWRATVYVVAIGAVVTPVSWVAIGGLPQVHRFLHVISSETHAFSHSNYSVSATLIQLGLGQGVAAVMAVIVSLALVAACIVVGRRRDERVLLVLIVALVLCASPIVWSHYFALLLVPLAVIRPRLGPIWIVLLVLWACPLGFPTLAESAVAAVTVCGVITALLVAARRLDRAAIAVPSSAAFASAPARALLRVGVR